MIFCQESNFLLKCILTGCVVCFLRLFMRKNFDTDKPCWHFCLVASNKGKNHRTHPFPCLVLSDVIIYSGISSFCDFWSNVSFFSACCVLLYVVNLPWKLSSLRHFQGPPATPNPMIAYVKQNSHILHISSNVEVSFTMKKAYGLLITFKHMWNWFCIFKVCHSCWIWL